MSRIDVAYPAFRPHESSIACRHGLKAVVDATAARDNDAVEFSTAVLRVRPELVSRVRKQIAEDTYEDDRKLELAITNMIRALGSGARAIVDDPHNQSPTAATRGPTATKVSGGVPRR